jgi:hypothetical protein
MGSTELTSALVATILMASIGVGVLATSKLNYKFGVSAACPIKFTEAAGTLICATAALLAVPGLNVLAIVAFLVQSFKMARYALSICATLYVSTLRDHAPCLPACPPARPIACLHCHFNLLTESHGHAQRSQTRPYPRAYLLTDLPIPKPEQPKVAYSGLLTH